MPFDDPIYLDWNSFDELMLETDELRLCWMYHDVLSRARVAWVLDAYLDQKDPVQNTWTSMAWVAAGHQPGSFYLLFKWYEDPWGPAERIDLYYVDQAGKRGAPRLRKMDQSFRDKLDERELDWCDEFPAMVSRNATEFFGEQDFWVNQMETLLAVAQSSRGRELAAFDRYFGRRKDGEKAMLSGTMAAYFQSIDAICALLLDLLERHDRSEAALLAALRALAHEVEPRMLPDLMDFFTRLSEHFFYGPNLTAYLTRQAGRLLEERTDEGSLRWLRLGNQTGRKLLRELYFRCAPNLAWDAFHRWNGALYFTALRRPLSDELPRGVCLAARFENQRGEDVTSLFWLENITSGEIRLCEGDFVEELLDLLTEHYIPTIDLPIGRLWEEEDVAACSYRLQDAFYHYYRGRS